jgi:hypothetical protein
MKPIIEKTNYRLENLKNWLVLIAFFSIPLSKAAPLSIAVILTIILLIEKKQMLFYDVYKNKFSMLIVIFYIINPISLMWSEDITFGIEKSIDLIWLVFLAIITSQFKKENIKKYLAFLSFGAFIHALIFYIGYFEVVSILNSTSNDPAFSGNRNTYGPIASIAGFALLYLASASERSPTIKMMMFLAAIFILTTVIINTSRTGHLILTAMTVGFIIQYFTRNKNNYKALLLTLLTIIIVSTMTVTIDSVQNRALQAYHEIKSYEYNPITSTGIRISFYENTANLQLQRSLFDSIFGSGVGDYVDDYNNHIKILDKEYAGLRKDNPVGLYKYKDPHSQYVYSILKFGWIGIILIIFLYIILIKKYFENKNAPYAGFYLLVLLASIINNISQSGFESRGLAPAYILILSLMFTKK